MLTHPGPRRANHKGLHSLSRACARGRGRGPQTGTHESVACSTRAFRSPHLILLSLLTYKGCSKIRQGNTTEMLCRDSSKPTGNKELRCSCTKTIAYAATELRSQYASPALQALRPASQPSPALRTDTSSRPHVSPPTSSHASGVQPLPSRTPGPYPDSATVFYLCARSILNSRTWRTRYGGARWAGAEAGSAQVARRCPPGKASAAAARARRLCFNPTTWGAALLSALLRGSWVGRGPRGPTG